MRKQFKIVACGGTFDHFHKGHKEFLRFAFSKGKKVVIGLTSDGFVQRVEKERTESYSIRSAFLDRFLRAEGLTDRAEVVQIQDVVGPTLSKKLGAEALIVSKETVRGARLINRKRKAKGLSLLRILIAPSVLAEDGRLISSLRIRQGEINRNGRLYIKQDWFSKTLILPSKLRKVLQKPFGRLIKSMKQLKDFRSDAPVITVGDITTKEFNRLGITQRICVVDFKVSRKKRFKSLTELGFKREEKVFKVKNPSGSLTPQLFKAVQKTIQLVNTQQQARIVLRVEGEEDLTVLPCLLSAPLDWTIFYGQPNEGAVGVEVTEESKEKAFRLVGKFFPRPA